MPANPPWPGPVPADAPIPMTEAQAIGLADHYRAQSNATRDGEDDA